MYENYKNLMDFSNCLVAVTGGAGLIGSEIVACFCAHGANVILIDTDQQNGIEIAMEASKCGGSCRFHHLDLTEVESIPSKVKELEQSYGEFFAWVNCAYPRTSDWNTLLEGLDPENWTRNINMQLNSYCIISIEIAKRMASRCSGSIVNIGSIQGHVAPDFSIYQGTNMTSPAAYSAIKGGIRMFSKYLASYFGRQNVRVNVVSPGGVVNQQPKKFVERYNEKTCLGRMAESNEVAPAVIFLSSHAASYITGTDLLVDGGLTAL